MSSMENLKIQESTDTLPLKMKSFSTSFYGKNFENN